MTQTRWKIDEIHSAVEFELQHMHVSTYRGRFNAVSGKVVLDDAQPENGSIEAEVEVNSFAAPVGRFFDILMGEDFFQSETHPRMRFRSTAISGGGGGTLRAEGLLSIRGIEKPVTLVIEPVGEAPQPFNRVAMRAFRATAELDRTAWGITWQAQLETGAAYLGEKVRLNLNVELLAES